MHDIEVVGCYQRVQTPSQSAGESDVLKLTSCLPVAHPTRCHAPGNLCHDGRSQETRSLLDPHASARPDRETRVINCQ